ncbi:flagellar motor switch protein FliG [Pseudooceanicola sp. C21-150M6]|uniref:flagellar motor switch protein FliG n=1 Tax=Pseudooceanicola sp. C21-150M6 TaxID=3434355 RepID=UPI003D7F2898
MAVTERQRTDTATRAKKRRPLKGPEKAAILFLVLGEQKGGEMMQKLTDAEIQTITRAMSGLGVIDNERVEEVLTDFTEGMANGNGVVGSFAVAEDMLRSFLPEDQVNGILKDIRGPLKERDLWARFSGLSETVIANYLKNEHDQTIAAILSNVKTDVCAKVLPLLGQEKMQNVVERMIRMEAVPHHMMKQIEETLQSDIINAPAQPTSGELQQRMADLFNKLDSNAFQDLSEVLEARMPETFGQIKGKMFIFDDLVHLDAMDLARVMRGAPGNALPMALRGAKKEVRDVFLNALPGRSRDMLEEEMNTMGPVRGRDVRDAQSGLVDYAKELADEEVIRLPLGGDDEDEFI